MTEPREDVHGHEPTEPADRTEHAAPIPDANQHKDEPFETTPEASPMSDSDSMTSADPQKPSLGGDAAPRAGGVGDGVAGVGDPKGVDVPSVHAAAGTSEDAEEVQGVRRTAIVSPGKPDGEVATGPTG